MNPYLVVESGSKEAVSKYVSFRAAVDGEESPESGDPSLRSG
jgi:hypothetical protein